MLKLVHTEFDTSDPCPVYDLHISVKPLRYVASENLACMGYEAPPESVEIAEKTTKLDVPCAFTDEMIAAHGDSISGVMDYDIVIELPHSDYFFDVEIKTDFLTGNFLMYMFTLDTSTNKWEKIAQSHWFDEQSFEDVSLDAVADMATKLGDKTMVQKLRYLEDTPRELLENSSTLMLRIKVDTHEIVKALTANELYDPHTENLCFNFDLSFFADEVNPDHVTDEDENKLIRVDWQGREQSAGKFDTNGRLNAFLEFEKSIANHIPALKATFQAGIYLVALDAQG